MKKNIIIVVCIIIVGIVIYLFTRSASVPVEVPVVSETPTTTAPTSVATTTVVDKTKTVIGTTVQSRDITAYHFGTGEKEVLFIGGIHGGYEWNTALVAFETMDYLKAHPEVIPANVTVTVIPVLNPDGLAKVIGTTTDNRFNASDVSKSKDTVIAGRFNANTVDLNRNFDCDWQAKGKWQNTTVSGGASAFSEPESQAIKTYVEAKTPSAVVVWYSAAGGVFASNCHDKVLPETKTLTETFAKASGYKANDNFNFYEITGDMVNWLAKNKIPAISVLLTNHEDTEWTKNQAGIDAVLKHFAQ